MPKSGVPPKPVDVYVGQRIRTRREMLKLEAAHFSAAPFIGAATIPPSFAESIGRMVMPKIHVFVESDSVPRSLEFEHFPRIGEFVIVPGIEGAQSFRVDRIVPLAKVAHYKSVASTQVFVSRMQSGAPRP